MKKGITIAVDVAKNVFQAHGVDAEGAVIVCRKGASRGAMPGIVGGTQRCPAGDFGSPEAGFPRGLDVVAMGFKVPVPPRQSRRAKTRIDAGHWSQS